VLVYALYFAASATAATPFGGVAARAATLALLAPGALVPLMHAAGRAPHVLETAVYELALAAPLAYALVLPYVAPPDLHQHALAALAAAYGLFIPASFIPPPLRDKATE